MRWSQLGFGRTSTTSRAQATPRNLMGLLIEAWDRASLDDQQRTIGRTKSEGAPIGRRRGHDPVDLRSRALPPDAHVRLASPHTNGGVRILRRGYSFRTGSTTSSASSTPACSSSPTSATPRRSSPCSGVWAPTMRSTSTSSTRRARCSPCRPACALATTGSGAACWPRKRRLGRVPVRVAFDVFAQGPAGKDQPMAVTEETTASPARAGLFDVFVGLLSEIDAERDGSPSNAFHDRLCEAVCRLTSMERAVLFLHDP